MDNPYGLSEDKIKDLHSEVEFPTLAVSVMVLVGLVFTVPHRSFLWSSNTDYVMYAGVLAYLIPIIATPFVLNLLPAFTLKIVKGSAFTKNYLTSLKYTAYLFSSLFFYFDDMFFLLYDHFVRF